MTFRRSIFIFVLIVSAATQSVWSSKALAQETTSRLRLSLQDCLDLAMQNNAKLPVRDYAISAAEQRVEEANVRFWPILDYSNKMAPAPRDASHSARSFFEGDVTFWNATHIGLGLPIYSFGQIDKVQEVAGKGLEVAHQEKIKDETLIHFEIVQLYNGILFSEELQRIAQESVDKIENQLKEEEVSHKHSPYDLLKLKVFKLDLEKRLMEAEEREKEARLALKVQMGLPETSSYELAESHLEPVQERLKPLQEYLAAAETDRPDSHLLDLGVRSKQLEYLLEKKKVLPRIGLGSFFEFARTASSINNLRLTDDFNEPFNYTRAGIGLEIKGQLDFHASSAKIKRLDSEYQKTVMERNLAKQGIQLEVEAAYYDAKRFQKTMMMGDEKQKMARQMMFLSKTNLDIGIGEEKDYTDALQLVLVAQGEYLKAVYDFNVSMAKLDQKTGRRYATINE